MFLLLYLNDLDPLKSFSFHVEVDYWQFDIVFLYYLYYVFLTSKSFLIFVISEIYTSMEVAARRAKKGGQTEDAVAYCSHACAHLQ